MSRKFKKRNVDCKLQSHFFKPSGIPLSTLEIKEISIEEIEAIRLSYIEGLSMIEGGKSMGVSSATFNRIIKTGMKKIADAILNSKAIKINN